MSGKEMRFQVPFKIFRLDGRITQRIRQSVAKIGAATEKVRVPNMLQRNHGILAGRSEMWAAGNFGRLSRSSWRGTLELGTEDSAEQLWQVCTAQITGTLPVFADY